MISFPALTGHRYGLEYSGDVQTWDDVAFIESGEDLSPLSWTDERLERNPARGFYRISVQLIEE